MLTGLLVVALAVAPPLTPVSPRLINVHGQAVLSFPADQLIASFQVVSAAREPAAARKVSEAKVVALKKVFADLGVSEKDVVIQEGAATPEYRGNEIISHTWIRSVTLSLGELTGADKTLTAVMRALGVQSGHLVLRSSAQLEWEAKARVAAAAAAKDRALKLVETLGGKLGLPRVVTDQTSAAQAMVSSTVILPANGGDATFARPELTVGGNVAVQFDIRDEP